MKKTLLFMMVAMAITTGNLNAQPGNVTASMQPCRLMCDSIINIDSVAIDEVALKDLQGKISKLDTLTSKIQNLRKTLRTASEKTDLLYEEKYSLHISLDSIMDADARNVDAPATKKILVRLYEISALKEEVSALMLIRSKQYASLQDQYNAIAYPTKLLYQKALKGFSLEDSKACNDAWLYRNGKKLLSLSHYMRF